LSNNQSIRSLRLFRFFRGSSLTDPPTLDQDGRPTVDAAAMRAAIALGPINRLSRRAGAGEARRLAYRQEANHLTVCSPPC
jgi:hypothetical protein